MPTLLTFNIPIGITHLRKKKRIYLLKIKQLIHCVAKASALKLLNSE